MIPIVNEMIDLITTRDGMRISKVPPLILWTLLTFVLIAAFLLGSDYKGHKRNTSLVDWVRPGSDAYPKPDQ
jgi:hypothetical protein